MIARQRSGTGALNTLFSSSLKLVCTGEFLGPDTHHEYSLSSLTDTSDCLRLADVVRKFADRLAADERHYLLDVKFNSLGFVTPPFRSFLLRPWLLDLFEEFSSKIIWIDRNPVHQWVSGALAAANQVWHASSPADIKVKKVAIDVRELQDFIENSQAEDRRMQEWLKRFSVLKMSYDEIFGKKEFKDTIHAVAEFLNVERLPGWDSARPATVKQASLDLSETVSNFEDIAPFLPDSEAGRRTGSGRAGPGVKRKAVLRLASLPDQYREKVSLRLRELDSFINDKLIPLESLEGGTVLDWECGDGAFSIALLLRGASRVVAIDSWLDANRLPPPVKQIGELRFRKAAIGSIMADLTERFDLVFANTVTEHMQDIPGVFGHVFMSLLPGGCFFTNHDNYYQPVGSHDHGFLYYGPGGVVRQGPKCWEHDTKCRLSDEHRANVKRNLPWTWGDRNEATKNPLRCAQCHYFQRSQPWAHLLYQNEFSTLFAQPSFSTGKQGSSLNKLTTFQIRQFLIEAGFTIEKESRAVAGNSPPEELLYNSPSFTALELQTTMYRVLSRRGKA